MSKMQILLQKGRCYAIKMFDSSSELIFGEKSVKKVDKRIAQSCIINTIVVLSYWADKLI